MDLTNVDDSKVVAESFDDNSLNGLGKPPRNRIEMMRQRMMRHKANQIGDAG